MANERQWVLWELHRGQGSLEQLFRELTADADEAEDKGAPDTEVEAEAEAAARATEAAPPTSEQDSEAES
jgi:hypothetical protein